MTTELNEYGAIQRLALRHLDQTYRNQAYVDANWEHLFYHDRPDFAQAEDEYASFADLLRNYADEIVFLDADDAVSMDAIYARDSSICSPKGMVLCNMGKEARRGEPALAGATYRALGIPVAGEITGEGRVEGGDFIWLDDKTCAVGWGYRTNAEGIRQLKAIFGPEVEVEVAPLPHYNGPHDCFHLMSFISPLDKDLALVYPRLMPVPFLQWLQDKGIRFVEVPDEEFPSMANNVLALAPRKCLAVDGNPITRKRMEAAGCEVQVYRGLEISRKGEGGPTCLTRPLVRSAK